MGGRGIEFMVLGREAQVDRVGLGVRWGRGRSGRRCSESAVRVRRMYGGGTGRCRLARRGHPQRDAGARAPLARGVSPAGAARRHASAPVGGTAQAWAPGAWAALRNQCGWLRRRDARRGGLFPGRAAARTRVGQRATARHRLGLQRGPICSGRSGIRLARAARTPRALLAMPGGLWGPGRREAGRDGGSGAGWEAGAPPHPAPDPRPGAAGGACPSRSLGPGLGGWGVK